MNAPRFDGIYEDRYQPEDDECQFATGVHSGFVYRTADDRMLCLRHVVVLGADMSPIEGRLVDLAAARDFSASYLRHEAFVLELRRLEQVDLAAARDYPSKFLAGEAGLLEAGTEAGDQQQWFVALGSHVAELAEDDPLVLTAEEALRPVLDNQAGIGAMIYPEGEAIDVLEQEPWGGDFRAYFERFVAGLQADYRAWLGFAHWDVVGQLNDA